VYNPRRSKGINQKINGGTVSLSKEVRTGLASTVFTGGKEKAHGKDCL
jgi:hypothetical protein